MYAYSKRYLFLSHRRGKHLGFTGGKLGTVCISCDWSPSLVWFGGAHVSQGEVAVGTPVLL